MEISIEELFIEGERKGGRAIVMTGVELGERGVIDVGCTFGS